MPSQGHTASMVCEMSQLCWKPSEGQQVISGQIPQGKRISHRNFVAKHSLPCCYLPAVLTQEKSIAAIHSRLMKKPLQSSWTTSPAVTQRYQETVFAPRKPLLNSCTHETIRLKSAGNFLGSFLYRNLDLR